MLLLYFSWNMDVGVRFVVEQHLGLKICWDIECRVKKQGGIWNLGLGLYQPFQH